MKFKSMILMAFIVLSHGSMDAREGLDVSTKNINTSYGNKSDKGFQSKRNLTKAFLSGGQLLSGRRTVLY